MTTYKTLYTVGYTGVPIDSLHEAVVELDAVLMDIRYSPFSRAPMWTKGKLRQKFGDYDKVYLSGEPIGRYYHVPQLGNEHYKTPEKGIKINDLTFGMEKVRRILQKHPVMLMCACPDPTHCHRTTVAEAIAKELEIPYTHLLKSAFKPGVNIRTITEAAVQKDLFE